MKLLLLTAMLSVAALGQGHYDKIIRQLEEIQRENPHIAELVTLGKNDQGVDIIGLKIESPESMEVKDTRLVVATHHGNERDAAPLAVEFANTLVETLANKIAYFGDDLKHSVYYVFPVLNISGYNLSRREEMDAKGRWHDPNRDYPDPCVNNTYFKLESIRLLATFIDDFQPSSAVTIHGYLGSFTYPWGFFTENDHTPDHDTYIDMASYSVESNGYRIGTHKEVLYAATGSFEDWAYLAHGVWTMLVEMQRFADFQLDTDMLMRYFSVAPRTQSADHQHYGSCSEGGIRDRGISRP